MDTPNGTKNMTIIVEKEQHTSERIEAGLEIDPSPEAGDYIEYSTVTKSRYFKPVWEEDIAEDSLPLRIQNRNYKCYDGQIYIQRTKKAYIEFRFPREYGLKPQHVEPFVGSYTGNVDYIVESEIQRARVEKKHFAGMLTIRMEIDSPLLRHIYGVAWNPKPRPRT